MIRIPFLLLSFFELSLVILAAPVSNLPNKYKLWLNEAVVHIIAASEREEFQALESDQAREEFIRHFWQIRDPDPSTEDNEFKIEHERRIRYANENFHSGKPGWRTDRGRTYIMHGPPDSISFEMGGQKLLVHVRNPTQILTGGLQDRRSYFPVELSRPVSEVWVYRHLSTATSNRAYFQIIFSEADPDQLYSLNDTISKLTNGRTSFQERLARDSAIVQYQNSQAVRGEMRILYAGEYRYQGVDDFFQGIFSPGLGPSFDRSELQGAIRDLARTSGDVLHENLRRERRLREVVESSLFFDQFSISVSHSFVRADSGSTLIPITVGIESGEAGDSLDLLIELLREDGTRAALIVDTMPIPAKAGTDSQGKEFLYQSRIVVRSGPHRLRIYGLLRDRKATALYEAELQVPDYSLGELMASEILFFDQVLPRRVDLASERRASYESRFLGGSTPMIIEDHIFIPATGRQFRRIQQLTLVLEVYNPSLSEDSGMPQLKLNCNLWKGEQQIGSIPQKRLDYVTDSGSNPDSRRTTYGLTVPLNSFQPGEYSLEFVVEDPVLKKSVVKRAAFRIH